jgi:hypothetical protein
MSSLVLRPRLEFWGAGSSASWLGLGESSYAVFGGMVVYLAAVESRRARFWAVKDALRGLIVDIL